MAENFSRPDSLTAVIAAELRAERGRKQVSQMTIAAAIGRGQSYVSDRLNGKAQLTLEEYVAICTVLDLEPGAFLRQILAAAGHLTADDYAQAADDGHTFEVGSETDEGHH